ncbi:hypothetical protein FBR02_08890 [Anaerolineae bacterium CFX9]|jgi:hypothetical protein|nr:hypothetical protein [Anaerolineae bacterium CFX9]
MDLTEQILNLVENPHFKTLVEVGAHDDLRSVHLAQHFKQVFCYHEFLKVPEREEGNLTVRRVPYLDVLDELHRYDVVLIENEFHHFPDIWQMWTYERLGRYQELLLVEWDMTGNNNYFYSAFQNCAPLCQLTREIMNRFISDKKIEIEAAVKGRYVETIETRQDLVDYYRYILPDHYPFGEKDFMRRAAGTQYPLELWEGFDLFKIRRTAPVY